MPDNSSAKWGTVSELFNSILIPLPYVLASLAFTSLVARPDPLDDLPLSNFTLPKVPVLVEISTLTSLTLVFVGLRGKIGAMLAAPVDKRKKTLTGVEEVHKTKWMNLARRIAARFLTVGLPFYATSKLGGARVTLVMLTALATNIMTIEEEEITDLTQTSGWNRLLKKSRWTLMSVLLQLISDLTGFTNSTAVFEILLGYITLGIAVFVLPPCFLSSKPRVSVVTSTAPASESKTSAVLATPWETPPQLQEKPSRVPTISPMICSLEDIGLTFYSGIVGLLSTIAFILFGPSAGAGSEGQLAWSFLSPIATALALTTANPKALRGNKKIGLVLGSLFSSSVLNILYNETWSSFVYQSIFIGFSFAATKLDTHATSSIPLRSDHHHHHHQPTRLKIPEHAQMSRFSEFVIQHVPHWPLLHSILAEKDSRRIFYFMW